MQGRFATVINCMDGRVQAPVAAWLKQHAQADYIDTITEPGPDHILADAVAESLESIRRRVLVSVEKHGSRTVAIVGHHDCAGYPVSRQEHCESVLRSVEMIASWALPVRILGLWVDEHWRVEPIADRPPTGT